MGSSSSSSLPFLVIPAILFAFLMILLSSVYHLAVTKRFPFYVIFLWVLRLIFPFFVIPIIFFTFSLRVYFSFCIVLLLLRDFNSTLFTSRFLALSSSSSDYLLYHASHATGLSFPSSSSWLAHGTGGVSGLFFISCASCSHIPARKNRHEKTSITATPRRSSPRPHAVQGRLHTGARVTAPHQPDPTRAPPIYHSAPDSLFLPPYCLLFFPLSFDR